MQQANNYRRISSTEANSNVVIRAKEGVIAKIIISVTSAHKLTVYDSISGATGEIFSLKASIAEGVYEFECIVKKGIVIGVPSGYTGEATILFRAG